MGLGDLCHQGATTALTAMKANCVSCWQQSEPLPPSPLVGSCATGKALTSGQSLVFSEGSTPPEYCLGTCVATANSLAMEICLGLFVLQKETEDCSVLESCPSSCTAASLTT